MKKNNNSIRYCLYTCYERTKQKSIILKQKRIDHVDTYFGEQINDYYRWLEDDRSTETEAWVKAQNVVTYGYLEQIPYRNQLKSRMEQLWNYEKIWLHSKKVIIHILLQNNGLQNQSVLYQKR